MRKLAPVSGMIVILVAVSTLSAQTPAAKTSNQPDAIRLLEDLAGAYRHVGSYSDHGEYVLETKIGGTAQTQKSPLQLTFERPNKISFNAGLAKVVCDGKTLNTVVNPLHTYFTAPAPETIQFDSLFRAGPVASSVFGGPSGPTMRILLGLAFANDPVKAFNEFSEGISIGADVATPEKTYKVLEVKLQSGIASLGIDPKSKLVEWIEVRLDTKGLAATLPKSLEVSVSAYRWNSGAIATGTVDDKLFAFAAPKDYSKVDTLADATGPVADGPKFKVQEWIGKPAPTFTLTLIDGPEKTKTVTKADLAGKVVVIDFWATWCGPCMKELPQIQEMIQAYAKAGKEVVIVALSQDSSSPDPLEIRKLVEKTLEKQKIELTGTAVGKIGLDPSGTIGEAFSVEGLPTVVILDAKGIVRSAHVGYSPEVGKTLTKEIDGLLDPKAPSAK